MSSAEIAAARTRYEAAGLTGIVTALDSFQSKSKNPFAAMMLDREDGQDLAEGLIETLAGQSSEELQKFDRACQLIMSGPQEQPMMTDDELRGEVQKAWDGLLGDYNEALERRGIPEHP